MTRNSLSLLFWGIIISTFCVSCTTYVAVFTVDAPELKMYENNYFVYESEKLNIHYDFWSEGGIPFMELINMSQDTLVFNFTKCRFKIGEHSFAFAGESWPKGEADFGANYAYNAMYGDMPQTIILEPDSVFSFQGLPMAFVHSDDLQREEEKRYLYNSSPYKIEQTYIYENMLDSTAVDTTTVHLYVNKGQSLNSTEFTRYKSGQPLVANKFYLYPYQPFTFDQREIVSEVLNLLFRE